MPLQFSATCDEFDWLRAPEYGGLTLNILLFLLMTSSTLASAKDEWLCTEESSQIQNGTLLACGVGLGKDENEARSKAFENARAEFIRVCDASDDCKEHKVTVEPKRTTCERSSKESYKCYRLLAFTISADLAMTREPIPSSKSESKNSEADQSATPVIEKISLNERNEVFQPFVFETIKNNPRVRVGMTKRELFAAFGAPKKSEPSWLGIPNTLEMMFSGSMCDDDSICYATVRANRVAGYRSFKPVYTEDLNDVAEAPMKSTPTTQPLAPASAPSLPPGSIPFDQFVSDDSPEGIRFLKKACTNGKMDSCNFLGDVEARQGNYAEATRLKKKSCAGGYKPACKVEVSNLKRGAQ